MKLYIVHCGYGWDDVNNHVVWNIIAPNIRDAFHEAMERNEQRGSLWRILKIEESELRLDSVITDGCYRVAND